MLQVNGESVIGMAHNKAVALIKRAKGPVSIAVSRPHSRPDSAKKHTAPSSNNTLEYEEDQQQRLVCPAKQFMISWNQVVHTVTY